MARDFVHALAELGVRIGLETGADAFVGCREGLASVLAQVMPAGGDAEVQALAVAEDGMHAETTRSGVPLPGVLVVADTRNHLPRIAAVNAPEQSRWLDTAKEVLLPVAGHERPDVCQRAAVVLREGRSRFSLLESLSEIGGEKDFHPEEGVAAGGVDPRLAARIDQGRVDTDPGPERSAQVELATALRRFRDEEALPGSDTEDQPLEHVSTS